MVPESVWRLIKTVATKKGISIYREIVEKYGK